MELKDFHKGECLVTLTVDELQRAYTLICCHIENKKDEQFAIDPEDITVRDQIGSLAIIAKRKSKYKRNREKMIPADTPLFPRVQTCEDCYKVIEEGMKCDYCLDEYFEKEAIKLSKRREP